MNRMKFEDLFQMEGEVGEAARAFVQAGSALLDVLAENGIELEVPVQESRPSPGGVDYDAPTTDTYRRDYRPITVAEIVKANKAMTQSIAGEKWMAGARTMLAIIMMAL